MLAMPYKHPPDSPEERERRLALRRGYEQKWRENNREKYLAVQRASDARPERKARKLELRRADPERYRAIQRRYRLRHPERVKERRRSAALLRSYGITVADYERMLQEQGGGCAICGQPNKDKRGRGLHVDHDHATGRVRGLLCSNCNKALGCFGDDPEVLRRACSYLEAVQRNRIGGTIPTKLKR